MLKTAFEQFYHANEIGNKAIAVTHGQHLR